MFRILMPWLLGMLCMAGPLYGQVAKPTIPGQTPNKEAETQLARHVRDVAQGINQSAADVYRRLAVDRQENLCFSPLGLALGLGAARNGARGDTEVEIGRLLHVPQLETFQSGCRQIVQRFRPAKPGDLDRVRLSVSIWCQEGDPFSGSFLGACRATFQAHSAPIDFKADPAAARNTINEWFKAETASRLPEVLPPGSLDDRSRLLIATVVDFAGMWRLRFDKVKTKPADFHLSASQTVSVPLMHKLARYRYVSTAAVQLVDLPFEDDLVMTLLVPRELEGLKHAEALLVGGDWVKLTAESREQLVSLDLPRFKIQPVRTDYVSIAQELGCRKAFSAEADFSGIRSPPDRDLSLRSLRHATWLEVDEDGTRAVAATSLEIGVKALPDASVRADRPFVFLIRDIRTGVILFAGRCVHPTAERETITPADTGKSIVP